MTGVHCLYQMEERVRGSDWRPICTLPPSIEMAMSVPHSPEWKTFQFAERGIEASGRVLAVQSE
jgi:hypothetical protein